MLRSCIIVLAAMLPYLLAAANGNVQLVPKPKQLTVSDRTLTFDAPEQIALVIGDSAAEPERYAGERLQSLIERRFGPRLPIMSESERPADAGPQILLGQKTTNSRLADICREHAVAPPSGAPASDAFAIEVLDDRRTIVACGSGPRGVIYGAQTLFKLLEGDDTELRLPVVSIRDWPSIPWRGRPYTRVSAHLQPGVLDVYMWAGLNFIDVRKGAFGYAPDADLDRESIQRCINQAHRRDLFVFGTVSCGVKPEKFDGVIRTFKELIDLGVDGLWISFDDPGGGVGTTDLARRVITFGKEHGITGRRIATTPPSGSYQHIETDFNREMARVDGMAGITWFFTRPPKADDVEAARRVGLSRLPAWWHNWPRTDAGFTHGSYGGRSFRPDGLPSYMEIPPLTWGWHRPQYDQLRDAAENTDTVMMWGGWQPEYTSAVLGIWAWNPAEHDFEVTRRAIYEHVYGGSSVETMMRLDDTLHEIKGKFALPGRSPDPKGNFPPYLKATSDREAVRDDTDRAIDLARSVAETARKETMLSAERLEEYFLEPMRAELRAASILATIERPERWWPEHEANVLARLKAGDEEAVRQLCDRVRPRLEDEVQAITGALKGLLVLDEYRDHWLQRAEADIDYWRDELRRREQAFEDRMADRKEAGLDIAAMTARIDDFPEASEFVDAVTPQQLAASTITHSGAWLTGLYPADDPEAFVMSFPGDTRSTPGDFCQVQFELECPGPAEGLKLQLHLTDEYDSDRWTKYRFYQLLHGGEVIWQEDIALKRTGGREWSVIDVSDLARAGEPLNLTLRLIDQRAVSNYPTTIFIGPIRLVRAR